MSYTLPSVAPFALVPPIQERYAVGIAMRGLLSKLLCLVAAITLMDGHIVALQSYAWASMLHERIPEQGVTEAITTTFDGEHPCEHCLTAQKLNSTENDPEKDTTPQFRLSGLKTIGLAHQRIAAPEAPSSTFLPHHISTVIHINDRTDLVPTPPPQLG